MDDVIIIFILRISKNSLFFPFFPVIMEAGASSTAEMEVEVVAEPIREAQNDPNQGCALPGLGPNAVLPAVL